MTNREWYFNKITKMSDEELAYFMEAECDPWCGEGCAFGGCEACMVDWLKKEHIEPMPKLENGMFVRIKYHNDDYDEPKLGVFVDGDVIYNDFNHTFDTFRKDNDNKSYLTEEDIVAIYNAKAFCLCNEKNCIWKKD